MTEEHEQDDDDGEDEPIVGLSVIRARETPIALVFRRGPTKQVRMIRWDLRSDDFQRGQWLAGRVYPERCDVSPNGTYVVYSGMRRGHRWQAVSKLPYFTPLVVWEHVDMWGGRGRWITNTRLQLRGNVELDPKFTLPAWLEVGADGPDIDRDGWEPAAEHAAPFEQRKPHASIAGLELQRRVARVVMGWPETARHGFVFRLFDQRGETEHDLGTADWADWHPSGDLAIARDGTIARLPVFRRGPGEPRVIADFNGETFEKLAPPPAARVW